MVIIDQSSWVVYLPSTLNPTEALKARQEKVLFLLFSEVIGEWPEFWNCLNRKSQFCPFLLIPYTVKPHSRIYYLTHRCL